jgi:hypothetical protein
MTANGGNSDTVDNKHYNQMAYRIVQNLDFNDGRPLTYQAAEFYTNNTEVTKSATAGWQLVKEFSIDLSEVNWLQFDAEVRVSGTSSDWDIREVTETAETLKTYVKSGVSDTTYAWYSAVMNLSSLTRGVHVFRLYVLKTTDVAAYNRGFHIHKNAVEQVYWS